MKIIFLDVDGVLNKALISSNSEPDDVIKGAGWMNKSLVKNLNKLTDTTDAKIVVSSSWRSDSVEETAKHIGSFGVTGEIIGVTKRFGQYSVRGNEIAAWIRDNEALLGCKYWHFKQYIIIDDDSDMLLSQAPHFIHTDAFAGLSESKAYVAEGRLMSFVNIEEGKTSCDVNVCTD